MAVSLLVGSFHPTCAGYTERLAKPGVEPLVSSIGEFYDSALAKTVSGLYKTKVIRRQSWKNREAVELTTLERADWFNHMKTDGDDLKYPTNRSRVGLLPTISHVCRGSVAQSK